MIIKSLADGAYDDEIPPSPRRVSLAAMLSKATDPAPAEGDDTDGTDGTTDDA